MKLMKSVMISAEDSSISMVDGSKMILRIMGNYELTIARVQLSDWMSHI